jgi:hypothetical protein
MASVPTQERMDLDVVGGPQVAERGVDLVEGRRERGGQALAGLGELQLVAGAFGELQARGLFQAADLAADGAVGDEQLLGGKRHAATPGEGLEGAQRGQRWKTPRSMACDPSSQEDRGYIVLRSAAIGRCSRPSNGDLAHGRDLTDPGGRAAALPAGRAGAHRPGPKPVADPDHGDRAQPADGRAA